MSSPATPDREPLALQEWLFLGCAVLAYAVFVVSLGKDTSWDFRNYHWYAPYAFLNGRLQIDMAVAHHATYYNPLLDVPFYWLATHTRAWFALGVMGAVQGANVVPIYFITRSLIQIEQRRWVAGAIAAMSLTGGLTVSLAGTTYYDNVLSVFTLSGLALLVWYRDVLAKGDLRQACLIAGIGALLTGSAVGLKLPQAPYAMGYAAALAVLPGTWKQRGWRLGAGALGGIAGLLLFSGYWWWKMNAITGNPLFPYFNQYFHSPLALDEAYRDVRFLPDSLREALLFPILFSIDYRVANDLPFADIRVGIAYLLVIATVPIWIFGAHNRRPLVAPAGALVLLTWAAVSYLAWLNIFAIYRYILALEILAPVAILCCAGLWPIPSRIQLAVAAGLLGVALLATKAHILERAPVDDPYVQVNLPPIDRPSDSMVLITGEAPLGFVVPELPPEIPVLRIDGWLMQPQDGSRLTAIARTRVKAFKGDLYVISNEYEMGRAREALADYDLSVNWIECRDIQTNLGGPYRFCPVKRGAEPSQ